MKIKVSLHARDLGAHICTGSSWINTTAVKRMGEATAMARKAKYLPVGYRGKATICRSKILSKAPYGCEANHFPDSALRALRAAIVDLISKGNPHRSNDFTFATSSEGTDLDPVVDFFVRRTTAIRRAICDDPNIAEQLKGS